MSLLDDRDTDIHWTATQSYKREELFETKFRIGEINVYPKKDSALIPACLERTRSRISSKCKIIQEPLDQQRNNMVK